MSVAHAEFLGRLLLLQTVCPVAGRAVAAGKSSSFVIYIVETEER